MYLLIRWQPLFIICLIGNIPSEKFINLEELKVLSEENPDCVAFNSFGYLKSDAIEKTTSPFMNPPHGLYVNVERLKEKINKKMLQTSIKTIWIQ